MSYRKKYPKSEFPFSDEICSFMDSSQEFHDSLKLSNTERFLFLRIILTSSLPDGNPLSKDQVIGLFYFDRKSKIFKQDFIVNKENKGREFYSYVDKSTKTKYASSAFVRLIDDFFKDYGENGKYYHLSRKENPWMHHYRKFEELPDNEMLRNSARDALDKYGET